MGGGFTGLWVAYYLTLADPGLDVVLVEAATVGSGASGRNGGFCSAVLPVGLTTVARRHGRDAAIGLQDAAVRALDEIESVLSSEQVSCGWRRGGMRWVATGRGQLGRLQRMVDEYRAFGFGDDHVRLEDPAATSAQVGVAGAVGSAFSPHSAAVNPAQLVWGLAEAVERRGVTILERTAATDLSSRKVTTERGVIHASTVVRATEGYTSVLPGHRRSLLPVYSHMIATPPLLPEQWASIGWSDGATLSDAARSFVYAQRTVDDRIAIGGRGATYHWGSSVSRRHDHSPATTKRLILALAELFPDLPEVVPSHEWGGVLAVPRAWEPFVAFDPGTGLAAAGGYSGDGVLMSNLAARALVGAIRGPAGQEQAGLGRGEPHRWVAEPLRWIGFNLANWLTLHLDGQDARSGRSSRVGNWICDTLIDP